MPVFNVTVIQRVTKFNEDRTENVVVDRVIAHAESVVAHDNVGAAMIAGTLIPDDYDKEKLSTALVKVQQTVA